MKRMLGTDTRLVLSTIALIALSCHLLLTGIYLGDGSLYQGFGYRQIVFALMGAILAIITTRVGIEWLQDRWQILYLVALGSIALVFFLGTVIRGSRRWIELGPVNIQPSEIGKVLVLLAVAGFIAKRIDNISSGRMFVTVLGLCALPALMVFVQPDFGTSQVYGYMALALLFFAGARVKHFLMLFTLFLAVIVLVLGVLPSVGVEVLHEFQKQRITGFLDPEADPTGFNYQAIQAKIAIGSGQLTGKDPEEASQVRQAFLPEPQTDFIFATLVERYGFVGGALLILVYLVLVSRCLHAVAVAPTVFGRLIAGGVSVMFVAQAATNIGMVTGIMPITGVPLPLVSYGGSAIIANLVAIGLVGNILRGSESAEVRYVRRTGRVARV